MASVHDVAAYILENQGAMTAMKLQKLVYYCQAWHLVWEDEPLFDAPIEAWANGPVAPDLFEKHRGKFKVSSWRRYGNPDALKRKEKETIDAVLDYYGDKSSQWLSDLTHAEDPWKEARFGLSDGERGKSEISLDSMARYYDAIRH